MPAADAGACTGCFRIGSISRDGEPNRFALHDLAGSDPALGLLAYAGRASRLVRIWAARALSRLEHSRVLARVDDQPVWSVVCFYVARAWRRKGITVRLLHAACSYAAEQGAHIIEGYPVEPAAGKRQADALVYTARQRLCKGRFPGGGAAFAHPPDYALYRFAEPVKESKHAHQPNCYAARAP